MTDCDLHFVHSVITSPLGLRNSSWFFSPHPPHWSCLRFTSGIYSPILRTELFLPDVWLKLSYYPLGQILFFCPSFYLFLRMYLFDYNLLRKQGLWLIRRYIFFSCVWICIVIYGNFKIKFLMRGNFRVVLEYIRYTTK